VEEVRQAEEEKVVEEKRKVDQVERKGPMLTADGSYTMPDGRALFSANGRIDRGVVKMSIYYDFPQQQLKINIREARMLPQMDSNGLCDPYIKLFLMPDPNKKTKKDHKRKLKSKVLKKNRSPVWEEKFAMQVDPGELLTHSLVVLCYDYDWGMRNDFIGRVEIDPETVPVVQQKEIDEGLDAMMSEATSWWAFQPDRNTKGIESGSQSLIEGAVKYPDGSSRLPSGCYMLKDGTEVEPKTVRGKMVFADIPKGQPRARYLEDATILLPDGTTILPSGAILRGDGTLRQPDGSITKATYLVQRHALPSGCKMLPDFSYTIADQGKKYPIIMPPDSNIVLRQGVIKFVHRYYSADSTLMIDLKECRGLPSMDSNGFSDPFVVFSVQDAAKQLVGEGMRSDVIKKTLNPNWGDWSFTIPLQREQLASCKLHVRVWDWDKGSTDDFIGQVVLDLSECKIDVPSSKALNWYALQPAPVSARPRKSIVRRNSHKSGRKSIYGTLSGHSRKKSLKQEKGTNLLAAPT
jgi:hypothetical protein